MLTTHESPDTEGTEAIEKLAGRLTENHDNRYPENIEISESAESYLGQLAEDLVLGRCDLHQLSPALSQFYTFAWQAGRDSLTATITRLRGDCDRYYSLAFNPPPKIAPNAKSYAQLERIRGNHDNADRIEAELTARFEVVL